MGYFTVDASPAFPAVGSSRSSPTARTPSSCGGRWRRTGSTSSSSRPRRRRPTARCRSPRADSRSLASSREESRCLRWTSSSRLSEFDLAKVDIEGGVGAARRRSLRRERSACLVLEFHTHLARREPMPNGLLPKPVTRSNDGFRSARATGCSGPSAASGERPREPGLEGRLAPHVVYLVPRAGEHLLGCRGRIRLRAALGVILEYDESSLQPPETVVGEDRPPAPSMSIFTRSASASSGSMSTTGTSIPSPRGRRRGAPS